jgi:hypothetical protein
MQFEITMVALDTFVNDENVMIPVGAVVTVRRVG